MTRPSNSPHPFAEADPFDYGTSPYGSGGPYDYGASPYDTPTPSTYAPDGRRLRRAGGVRGF